MSVLSAIKIAEIILNLALSINDQNGGNCAIAITNRGGNKSQSTYLIY